MKLCKKGCFLIFNNKKSPSYEKKILKLVGIFIDNRFLFGVTKNYGNLSYTRSHMTKKHRFIEKKEKSRFIRKPFPYDKKITSYLTNTFLYERKKHNKLNEFSL